MLLDRIGPPGRCSGCWPHDGEVAGGAVADLDLMISGDRFYLFYHPYARARALMARPWSARCYGVARQRDRSRQNSTGVSGVLSLYPLARGCRKIWRGVVLVYWFRRRDAARPDRAAWAVQRLLAARWRGRRRCRRRFRFNDFRGPLLPLLSPLRAREGADGQAVVGPLLRGRSPTRSVAPKQHRGLRRAFPLCLGAWGPQEL